MLTLAVLTVFTFVAAQCTAGPVPAQPTQASGQPAGKATIVYWSMFSEGEPLMKVLDQATKDFNKDNPDIEVQVKWAGREVLTQLQSAIAAKTQVDIVDHSDDRVFAAIVKNNLALPLDKYLAEKAYDSDKSWKDTFLPGAFDQLKGADGQVYMIPRDDYISAFFYNVKMLDEIGIKPNATDMSWTDFVGMLDKIKTEKVGVAPLGADGNIAFYNNWWFTYLAVRLAGKDAFRNAAYDKTGESWGQPEFLQAAKMVRELQDKGFFQKAFEGSVWPAAQVDWVNSKIAMMFMGAWLPKEMSEQTPEGFQIGMFSFPKVDGGKGNDWVEHWANVYGVLNTCKNPDAAAKYLKYITSLKIGTQIAESGTPVPLVGAPVPPALENQYAVLKTYQQMPARAGLNIEIPDYMEKVFNPADDKFFQKQIGPEELINTLKAESKKYWETPK